MTSGIHALNNSVPTLIATTVLFIMQYSFFHVCDGSLLPDVMHDVLEGALQYEVKVMLQEMVYLEGYFSLVELNSRLSTLELGYMEAKDRPTPFNDQKLSGQGHTLSQAGTCTIIKMLLIYAKVIL